MSAFAHSDGCHWVRNEFVVNMAYNESYTFLGHFIAVTLGKSKMKLDNGKKTELAESVLIFRKHLFITLIPGSKRNIAHKLSLKIKELFVVAKLNWTY